MWNTLLSNIELSVNGCSSTSEFLGLLQLMVDLPGNCSRMDQSKKSTSRIHFRIMQMVIVQIKYTKIYLRIPYILRMTNNLQIIHTHNQTRMSRGSTLFHKDIMISCHRIWFLDNTLNNLLTTFSYFHIGIRISYTFHY